MVEIGGIEIKTGDKVDILGKTFVIDIECSLAGEFVVWQDENSLMRIYATPNFEVDCIPIQVDYDTYNIAFECYEGKINNYEDYKKIVAEKIEKLLTNLPKCTCETDYLELNEYKPIEIKGYNFSICGYCSRVLGNKEDIKKNEDKDEEKDVLNKDKVVEELNTLLDHYFEEKADELKLKYGDISPDQVFILDDSIEKIADVVRQWANQNTEEHCEKMKND